MPRKLSVPAGAAIVLACCVICTQAAIGEDVIKSLPRPGEREFVRDLAEMLSFEDEQEIKRLCDELLTAKATPVIVVTIKSMADHGGRGMRIETFARLLFDQWQIGIAKINKQSWNTGILLLVSKGDRKARIELGAGWKRDKDDQCAEIMEELIIPKFKEGEFSRGIVVGVEALDKMARELKIPRRPRPASFYLNTAGAIGLGIFTIVSLWKKGSSGWAWLFWGMAFALLGLILRVLLETSEDSGFLGSSSGGGGFSGGSFSGGFSGGGGATGSW